MQDSHKINSQLVSVIIPIYNIERNISYCLDSTLKQTYESIEIIAVDDGSTDNSGNICDDYKNKYDNIIVVHQKNGGLSCARNTGLRHASGEFVFFLDGDDIIASDTIELLVSDMKTHSELIYTSILLRRIKTYGPFISRGDGSIQIYSTYKMIDKLLAGGYENMSACGKLYRKSSIGEIRFIEGRIYNEDKVFMLMLFIKNKNAFFLEHNVEAYGYYFRENSITTAKFSEKRLDLIRNSQTALNITKKYVPEYTAAAIQYDAGSHLALMHNIIRAKGFFKYYRLYHAIKHRLYKRYGLNKLKMLGKKKIEYLMGICDPAYICCVKLYDLIKKDALK